MRSAWHHDPRIRLTDQQIAKLFLERHGCCRESLRLVSTRNMSEGQRNQISGLKKRITQALGKAA